VIEAARRDYNPRIVTLHRFPLKGEFIPLNDLLKLLGLVPSGGAAKALIAEGTVVVDGAIETRIRCKLRAGQVVRFADEEIRIVAADAAN
jgi:ribosome-associated protein